MTEEERIKLLNAARDLASDLELGTTCNESNDNKRMKEAANMLYKMANIIAKLLGEEDAILEDNSAI